MKKLFAGQARTIGAFLLACLVGFVFEHAQSIASSLLGAEAIYQRVVTRGFRAPIPRFTAVVTVREGQEPPEVTLVNACEQRRFLARLITAIADAGPHAIVIDKYFKDKVCDSNPSGTTALQDALSQLEQRHIPVVVGRLIADDGQLMPALAFSQSNVTEGEITLEEDERRAALRWTLTDGNGRSAGTINTLSMAAALAHTPRLLQENRRLSSFYDAGEAPFVSFLPRSAYQDYSFAAIKVMCGESATATTPWRTCSHADANIAKSLRGRLVLIGEDSGLDAHAAVIGQVPGVLLQAIYVEAILDDALFAPISSVLTYVYGALVFILLKGLIEWSPKGVIAWVALGVLLSYAVTVALAPFGYYLNPGLGIIALVFGETLNYAQTKIKSRGAARVAETG